MGLNRKACRAWTSSALVHPANRLALQPDSYPLAIGYWRLVKANFNTKTQRTQSEDAQFKSLCATSWLLDSSS
jgi:hypothetical protein